MLAIVAACVFGLAIILEVADGHLGEITPALLLLVGLLLLALHVAGVGHRRG